MPRSTKIALRAAVAVVIAGIALLPAFALKKKPRTAGDPGRIAYERACAACHLSNLAGSGPSPGLIGAEFRGRWQNLTGADLLERVSTTMPVGRPGALKPTEYRSITVYLLKTNGIGKSLPPYADRAALSRVLVK